MPALMQACSFWAMMASVTPKCWRCSEWPMMHRRTPNSASMVGETSPVKAPSGRGCTFCAPSSTGVPAAASAAAGR